MTAPSAFPPELDLSWQDGAPCAAAPVELFFPEADLHREQPAVWQARKEGVAASYCRPCPVRLECLTHAMSFPEKHGFWAGTDPQDRQRHMKAGRTPAHALALLRAAEDPQEEAL